MWIWSIMVTSETSHLQLASYSINTFSCYTQLLVKPVPVQTFIISLSPLIPMMFFFNFPKDFNCIQNCVAVLLVFLFSHLLKHMVLQYSSAKSK